MVLLVLFASGCSGASSRAWNGYLYGDLALGAPLQVSGPYPSLDQCRAEMTARVSRAPADAGYACGRGCPAPRNGEVADCAQTSL